MNINRALRDERLMKGVTGMSIKGFNELLKDFKQNFEKEKRTNYNKEVKKGKLERKPGGGRKGRLETLQDKLFLRFFILNAILLSMCWVLYLILIDQTPVAMFKT